MKTKDIKVNNSYIFIPIGELVTVLETIKSKDIYKRDVKVSIIKIRTEFRLSNGLIVTANKLKEL